MYPNILSAVTQFLTPGLIAKMASLLGLDRAATQKTVDVAVPALLSGFANLAASPEGARQLSTAVAEQPQNTLGNLAQMLEGSARIADSGKSLLASLLGGGTLTTLASGVSKFAGVSDAASGSVLGLLAPAMLGILGRKQREEGLSTSDLAQMLTAQKKDFIAAMPAGLPEHLSRGSADDLEPRPASVPTRTAMRAGSSAASQQSASHWAYWALPLAALVGLGSYLLSSDRSRRDEPARTTDVQKTTVAPVKTLEAAATIKETDLGRQVTETINVLQGHIQAVRDAGAAVALPKLREMSGQLDRLSELAGQLPAEARERVGSAIEEARAKVRSTVDAIPQVASAAPELMPTIDALKSKLDAMTGAGLAYLAKSPANSRSLALYLSRDVYNGAGEKLGAINDFLIAPDGRITAAIVGVGGFLGIGEKDVAVQFDALKQTTKNNKVFLVLNTTKDALKSAPGFKYDRTAAKWVPENASK